MVNKILTVEWRRQGDKVRFFNSEFKGALRWSSFRDYFERILRYDTATEPLELRIYERDE